MFHSILVDLSLHARSQNDTCNMRKIQILKTHSSIFRRNPVSIFKHFVGAFFSSNELGLTSLLLPQTKADVAHETSLRCTNNFRMGILLRTKMLKHIQI